MRNKKGFTLIELIVTIALIGIISVSMLTVFNTGLVNIVRAGVRTEGVNLAESEFDINPTIIEEKSLAVVIPTSVGSETHTVTGSEVKGLVVLNEGLNTQVDIEIKAFVPGIYAID